jgi:hypothetical protein
MRFSTLAASTLVIAGLEVALDRWHAQKPLDAIGFLKSLID